MASTLKHPPLSELNPAIARAEAEFAFRKALIAIGLVLEHRARTHPGDNWRTRPAADHIERARRHLELLSSGDYSEGHLVHAATRLLMALETPPFALM